MPSCSGEGPVFNKICLCIALSQLLMVVACGSGGNGGNSATLFYVATNGNDSWTGTLPAPNVGHTDGPFATIDRARVVVRGRNKTGLTQVTVQIRAGTYFQPVPAPPPLGQTGPTASLIFSSFDSGTSSTEIVYENYPNESPVISGGMRVTNWVNSGGNVWTATLPSTAMPFENLFYNGARRLRPRVTLQPTQNGYLGDYLRIFNQVVASSPSANCPSKENNECFDRFQYCDPTTSGQATSCDQSPVTNTWANLTPPQPPGEPCSGAQPPGNGAPNGNIELLDFEQFTASKLRISCIDTAKGIIYLTGPTKLIAGSSGFIPGHRYLIENVKDFLSQPGQWFLDQSQSPMTLTYLANPGEDPNIDTVIVPQSQQVMVAYGLQYVTFQGLTFAHDNFTIPSAGYQSQDLDEQLPAAVSFQDVQNVVLDSVIVTQTAGAGVEFLSCGVPSAPSWCLLPQDNSIPVPPIVTANDTVQNSAFYDLGGSGIRIGVPESPSSDTESNIPQSITVKNTVVEGWGRVFPSTFGIGQGVGHDNQYDHNDVYDGYHVAISACLCSSGNPQNNPNGLIGSNNLISFNHVHDTHQGIMNDGGAIRIGDGNGSYVATGNEMINNKVHDVNSASALDGSNSDPSCVAWPAGPLPCDGYGGNGIYLDNQSGNITVANNLVYRVSENAVYFPMSPYAPNPTNPNFVQNNIFNNILAYARNSMINISNPFPTGDFTTPPNLVFQATSNIFYFDRSDTSPGGPFYVQGGCTWNPDPSTDLFNPSLYTNFEEWDYNVYYRADVNNPFGSDGHAFHMQNAARKQINPPSSPCTSNTKKWAFYSFGPPSAMNSWQSVGSPWLLPIAAGRHEGASDAAEDTNSVVLNPWAANPSGPANDDYSLPVVPAGIGFMVFDPNQAGRSNPVIQPPKVPGTFVTKTYDPASF